MEVPVHGKIWHIPRPSLWWKSRHQQQGDVESGWQQRAAASVGRDAAAPASRSAPRPSYAASDASTSSSSTTTPVGSLHSPLVREGHARPTWIPTALPSLDLDGGLKKVPAKAPAMPDTHPVTDPLSARDLAGDAKAEDSVSIASSTHFTVVGGYGGGRGVRGGSRGLKTGKITALVLSMSLLILIGILAAILFLEVRARNMHWPKTT